MFGKTSTKTHGKSQDIYTSFSNQNWDHLGCREIYIYTHIHILHESLRMCQQAEALRFYHQLRARSSRTFLKAWKFCCANFQPQNRWVFVEQPTVLQGSLFFFLFGVWKWQFVSFKLFGMWRNQLLWFFCIVWQILECAWVVYKRHWEEIEFFFWVPNETHPLKASWAKWWEHPPVDIVDNIPRSWRFKILLESIAFRVQLLVFLDDYPTLQ